MSKHPKRYHIYVNYFIQNDSWESISHPNLFVLPQEFTNLNDVKAQMIYDNFPLINKESYYLRFFLDDKTQNVKGWVDFPPNAVVPIYNEGHVYVKALRLPKGTKIDFKNQDVYKEKETSKVNKDNTQNLFFMEDEKKNVSNTNMNPNMNTNMNTNMNNPQTNRVFDQFEKDFNQINMNGNSPQNQPPIQNKNSQIYDDWGAFTGNNGSNNNNNMNNNMNNINTNMNNINTNSNNNTVDPSLFNVFSNMTDNSQSQPEPQPYDFTAANANGSQMFPIDKIPTNISEDEIKEKVDQILNKWILGGEGKKNLLFLLTTLHEVWTLSNLGIPEMQTLVNDKASVRTYYKKAMRELHADKNRDKDFKTKYIASCLYQILNEANANY